MIDILILVASIFGNIFCSISSPSVEPWTRNTVQDLYNDEYSSEEEYNEAHCDNCERKMIRHSKVEFIRRIMEHYVDFRDSIMLIYPDYLHHDKRDVCDNLAQLSRELALYSGRSKISSDIRRKIKHTNVSLSLFLSKEINDATKREIKKLYEYRCLFE